MVAGNRGSVLCTGAGFDAGVCPPGPQNAARGAGHRDLILPGTSGGISRRTFASAVTAFDPELFAVLSSGLPARRPVSDRVGRRGQTCLLMGLRFDRRMAAPVLHTPVFDCGPLGISASAVCALRCGVSRSVEQSADLDAVDHGDWRDVLFDLPGPLRSDLFGWTHHEAVRTRTAESCVSRASVAAG